MSYPQPFPLHIPTFPYLTAPSIEFLFPSGLLLPCWNYTRPLWKLCAVFENYKQVARVACDLLGIISTWAGLHSKDNKFLAVGLHKTLNSPLIPSERKGPGSRGPPRLYRELSLSTSLPYYSHISRRHNPKYHSPKLECKLLCITFIFSPRK